MLSAIIPAFKEGPNLIKAVESLLQDSFEGEIIIVIAGPPLAVEPELTAFSAVRLLHTDRPGRAVQMNYGAQAARFPNLFFMHADSLFPAGGYQQIIGLLEGEDAVCGSFLLRFDERGPSYRFLEWYTGFNVAITSFGDQGLFIRKSDFDTLGRFREIEIMEDLDIQLRVRRRLKYVKIKLYMVTSARRFRKNGVLWQILIDGFLIIAFLLGVPPRWLKKLYY